MGGGHRSGRSRVPGRFEPDTSPAIDTFMTGPAAIVPWQLSVSAARKVAALRPMGLLLVEADGVLVGMVDGRALDGAADTDPVTACMKSLRFGVRPTMTVARARELLILHRLTALPVVVGRFLVGTISRQAVERAIARPDRVAAAFKRAAA